MSKDQITTRAKAKLKLTIQKENETPLEFTPQHRSTGLFSQDPFQKSSRLSRSPKSPQSARSSQESRFNFPPARNIEPQKEKATTPSSAPPHLPEKELQLHNTKKIPEQNQPQHQENPTPTIPPKLNTTISNNMANITLSQSIATAKTPAKPKFICPPTFSPCSGNASSFLKNYERNAAANGWDETLKIGYLDTFLEGAANLWFQRYKEKAENANKTWEDVKNDFLGEYETEDLKRVLERRLYERKQKPEESIKSYYYELQNLFGEYDNTFNLNEFRKFFENGIKRNLYQSYRLIVGENMDWDDFKTIVNKLEDISYPPVGISEQSPPNTGTQCSCTCTHQQVNRSSYQDRRQDYRFPPRQPNFRNNNQSPGNRIQYNDQNLRTNTNNRRPPQRPFQGQYGNNIPNTRTHDGRPRCYVCNRIGHYANTCNARSGNRYPNSNGRHN